VTVCCSVFVCIYRSLGHGRGLMRRRIASINDLPIKDSERKYHWPFGKPPCWLTNRKNIPTAINAANRIPTTNETTGCRLAVGFDPAPFCAAPRPNQKRSLSIRH